MLVSGGETEDQIGVRIGLIADSILLENNDVVCLQEVWSDKQRKILLAKLRDNYPYIIIKSFFNLFYFRFIF